MYESHAPFINGKEKESESDTARCGVDDNVKSVQVVPVSSYHAPLGGCCWASPLAHAPTL